MYYLGFKPSEEESYFCFGDIKLPKWIPSLSLPENSAHEDIVDQSFGTHWWEDIYNTCLKCTSKECKKCTSKKTSKECTSKECTSKKTYFKKYNASRIKALNRTILLLAEPTRLCSLKEKVKTVINSGVEGKVGSSEEGIHSWKTMSKIGFQYMIDPNYIKSMKLLHQFTEYKLFNIEKKQYEPWKIIGSSGEILVFKYDEILVPQIIKKQQDKALNTICSVLGRQALPSGNWKGRIPRTQHPNILIYLAYLLSHGEGFSFEIRRDAGLLLENSLQKEFCAMVAAHKEYIKTQLIPCIYEANPLIRSTAGVVIIQVLRIIHAEEWKELILSLQNCLDSGVFELVKGAMDLIVKICREVPSELEQKVPDLAEQPINIFFTRWLKMFESPHSDLRMLALECADKYIIETPSLFDNHIDRYLEVLICLYEKIWAAMEEKGWEEMSAVVMSMGYVAENCINIAHSRLPEVIAMLTLLLREEVPSLLSVACKTLSRYSKYIVQSLRHPNGRAQFKEILGSLLEKKAHSDFSVQSGVSLALKTLEQEAATLETIIDELSSPMDPFPLLSCLASVAKAVQPDFCKFILPVFRGSTLLLKKMQGAYSKILCGTLELLTELLSKGLSAGNGSPSVQGMLAGIQSLIQQSSLISMLDELCSDEQDNDVVQRALNLLVELSEVAQEESLAKVRIILARIRVSRAPPRSLKLTTLTTCTHGSMASGFSMKRTF